MKKIDDLDIREFFIIANSFAAPFFSDTSKKFIKGETPELALLSFVKGYSHPCNLYSAELYVDANAYYKGKGFLIRWLSNHAIFLQDKVGRIRDIMPGEIEIDGKIHVIKNPKDGRIVS